MHARGIKMSRMRVCLFSTLMPWRNAGSVVIMKQFTRLYTRSGSVGENYQVMAADQRTIICYHSHNPVSLQETKPLRKQKMWEKRNLTEEEVTLVRKLRQEDGNTWSVVTLSRLFKVSPTVISRVAPASEERQRELDEEREILKKMRPHKRKLYLLQRQTTRQKKLKELIAQNKYSFPGTPPELSHSQ